MDKKDKLSLNRLNKHRTILPHLVVSSVQLALHLNHVGSDKIAANYGRKYII